MPAWGISAVGGSLILISALAADMALVQIHGFAFADGAVRPETFPARPQSTDGTVGKENGSTSSSVAALQAAAEARRAATQSHQPGQRLPTWGPHDYCSHPNYALLQSKALDQAANEDAAATTVAADAAMLEPGGQLSLDQLMATRETASRWWYRVSSSPAWPVGMLLSAGMYHDNLALQLPVTQ